MTVHVNIWETSDARLEKRLLYLRLHFYTRIHSITKLGINLERRPLLTGNGLTYVLRGALREPSAFPSQPQRNNPGFSELREPHYTVRLRVQCAIQNPKETDKMQRHGANTILAY
jgi:hypothetical protein